MMIVALGLVVLAGFVLSIPARPLERRPAARGRSWRDLGRRVAGAGRRRRAVHPVGRVLVEVAARLRVGADLATAWERSLPDPEPPWAPMLLESLGMDRRAVRPSHRARGDGVARGVLGLPRRWFGRQEVDGPDIAAALAACRLTRRSGAPLAEVIDVVVGGIDEAREANELRTAALAGPRATATLLAWLPVGGLGLGVVLGADPIGVLLGGGLGGLSLVLGLALFVAGRQWVRVLVAQAERAGA